MYELERSDKEINDLIEKCYEQSKRGTTKYRGMTYEDGVRAALDWVTGQDDANPMDY